MTRGQRIEARRKRRAFVILAVGKAGAHSRFQGSRAFAGARL